MSNGIADLRRYEEGGSVPGRLWDRARGLSSTRAGAFAGMLPIIGEGTDLIEIGAGAEDFIKRDKSDAVRRMLLGLAGLALPFATGATIKKLTPRIKSVRSPRWPTQPPAKQGIKFPTRIEDFGYRWAKGDPSDYENVDAYMNAVDMSGDPIVRSMLEEELSDPLFLAEEKLRKVSTKPADLLDDLKKLGIPESPHVSLEKLQDITEEERILLRELMPNDSLRLELLQNPDLQEGADDWNNVIIDYIEKLDTWRGYNRSPEGMIARGVRNPRDYETYEDYIRAVEEDILELGIEGYDPDFRFNFDGSSGGGISAQPPFYDPNDPFFNPSATPYEYDQDWRGQGGGLGDIDELDGDLLDPIDPNITPEDIAGLGDAGLTRIPDDELPENWWWPTEGMTDDEYMREIERIRNLSFGGKKRFLPFDPLDDLPF